MRNRSIAIVGGGVSGLSFAHYCAQNAYAVSVFEKEGQAGGCVASHQIASDLHVELGGHTLTNSYGTVIDLIAACGKAQDILPRPPLRFALAEGRHRVSLTKRLHAFELVRALCRPGRLSKTKESVRSYYARLLGEQNYADLFHYAFQAVLSQNPDEFPADLLFRKRGRRRSFPKKFVLAGGNASLFRAILENSAIEFHRNRPITRVTFANHTYDLWAGSTKVASAAHLGLSCPPETAAQILEPVEPTLADLLRSIRSVNVGSVLLSSPKKTSSNKKQRSLIGVDQPFLSALHHAAPDADHWVVHFDPRRASSQDVRLRLGEILDIAPGKLAVATERSTSLPALTVENLTTIDSIDRFIADKPIFLATNYMQGLSIEDCCSRSANEAARLVRMT